MTQIRPDYGYYCDLNPKPLQPPSPCSLKSRRESFFSTPVSGNGFVVGKGRLVRSLSAGKSVDKMLPKQRAAVFMSIK